MSKLLKTAVASLTVLAALAFGASSAWADASDSLPSLNASDWTGVTVLDVDGCTPTGTATTGNPCTFVAHSTHSLLYNTAPPATPIADCEVSLTVDVYGDGSTRVTDGDVVDNGTLCDLIEVDVDPAWTNQVCQYTAGTPSTADDEYWDGIDVRFTVLGTPVPGDLYGQLQPSSPFSRIDVESEVGSGNGFWIQANGSAGSTPYVFEDASGNPIELEGESNEDPCSPTGNGAWDDLS